jgi:hypothetical protein
MDSKDVLKEALVVVRQGLKVRGLAAKGTTYFRRIDGGNTEVVSVQKSTKSSSIESLVTLNYGAYSARVGGKLGDDASSSLDVAKTHWRKRLSQGGREQWLSVKAADLADETAKLILSAVDGALQELNEQSTDEKLRDTWLAGLSPGIGAMQRLLFLAILVKDLGPAERLPTVIAELRQLVSGSVHEGLVERQLAMIGVQK